jgi:hypothetical protein
MKKVALLALLAHSLLAADFAKWWPEFQAAVAKADAKAVARRAHFPLDWKNGKVRQIKSEADLEEFRRLLYPGDPQKHRHQKAGTGTSVQPRALWLLAVSE